MLFFLCFFMFLFIIVLFLKCFRLVFLSFCFYNRKTHKNIKQTTEQLKEKQKHIKKQKSPSRNLRYIYSRSGRGLDILYFCCFYVFLWVFMFFILFFWFLCSFSFFFGFSFFLLFLNKEICFLFRFCFCFFIVFLCFRLVFLSFCIYNRNNTYNNKTNNKQLEEQHNEE